MEVPHVRQGRPGPIVASIITGVFFTLELWAIELWIGGPERIGVALSGLFFLQLVLLPPFMLVGLYLLLVSGRDNPYALAWSKTGSLMQRLLSNVPDRGFALLCAGIRWGVYLGTVALSAFFLCRWIAQDVIQSKYQAILSVAATFGCLFVSLPILPLGSALHRRLAPGLAHQRFLARLWSQPLQAVFLLGLACLTIALVVTWVLRGAIAAAPWQIPALLVGCLVLALLAGSQVVRGLSNPAVIWGVAMTVLALAIAPAFAAGSLASRDYSARHYLLESPGTSLAYGLVNHVLDRDGDGFMHGFAGGDCAPDNSRISPVAVDIPGNGIDEDCSGSDLSLLGHEKSRWDHPNPPGFPAGQIPVVLVSSDALSAYHVSFMGYERETTPNLDRWAESCVVFDKAFSQGPSTRLSLASAFTGKYDSQVKRTAGRKIPYPVHKDNTLLAEMFKKAGYETVFVAPNSYFHSRWKGITQGFKVVDKSASKGQKGDNGAVHNADMITESAIHQLRKGRSKPLFMWVHYYDAHPPFGQPSGVPEFGTARKDLYDAEILWWDQEMAPLLDEIDKLYAQTGYLLILTADHGASFDANHKRHTHGYDLHTSVLHIPMLYCSPHLAPKHVQQTPVTLLDMVPTLVNLCGLKAPDSGFEGTSLVPLLTGTQEWEERKVYHQFYLAEEHFRDKEALRAVAVRSADYNYIWNRKKDQYHFFNYSTDPFESKSLMDSEVDLAVEYDDLLKSWLFRVHKDGQSGYDTSDDPARGPYDEFSPGY
jgi:arylsulfatase A-like enzyme